MITDSSIGRKKGGSTRGWLVKRKKKLEKREKQQIPWRSDKAPHSHDGNKRE